ncbi:MAG: hypothetical protein K2X87_20095 [Gemmataceae bacterium]|nr:hypothetical protein [Gemmataceae bacterium]
MAAFARYAAESNGRPLGPRRPVCDGHLPDGSRVCVVVPPAAPAIHANIRPRRRTTARLADLVGWGR